MRKLGIALIASLAIFTAACSGSDAGTDTPSIVLDGGGRNAEKAALCSEAATAIQEGLSALSDGVDLLPYVSASDRAEFLITAREFVRESITTVELCADLAPTEAAALLSSLHSLEDAIDLAL